MYIDNDISVIEMELKSFTEQVNHEITTETKPIEYVCLCGEDTTAELNIVSSTMCDYVNFFARLHAVVDYGTPTVIKKLVYEPDKIEKTLIVVRW
nr:MAG TPA: hypothetical protein [Bacteriophage sp.]